MIIDWAWCATVTLACIGLLTALLAGDHLLASRSAGVLLLSFTLFSVSELIR